MSVNWQDSDIIVKSIDQSLNSCESLVQSRVQVLQIPATKNIKRITDSYIANYYWNYCY